MLLVSLHLTCRASSTHKRHTWSGSGRNRADRTARPLNYSNVLDCPLFFNCYWVRAWCSVRWQVEKIKSIIRKCCRRTWTVGRTFEDTVTNGFNKLAKRSHGIPFRDMDFGYLLYYFCVNKNEFSKVSHTARNLKKPCCIKKAVDYN